MSRKEEAIKTLRSRERELRAIGVDKIGVFGSVARGSESKDSDVDILVQFTTECHKFRNFNELCDLLDSVFGERYDLVTVEGLSPHIGSRILEEVVYVPLAS